MAVQDRDSNQPGMMSEENDQKIAEPTVQEMPAEKMPDDIIGMVAVRRVAVAQHAENVLHNLGHRDDSAELLRLQVSLRARGKGVGRRLVRVAEDYARGRAWSNIILSTITLHDKARRLYESEGFVKVKESNHGELTVVHYRKVLEEAHAGDNSAR